MTVASIHAERHSRRSFTAQDVCAVAGITYRQLDYWTRTGHLHASADSGAGYDRLWPAGEIRVARATKALLDAGFGLAVAREISRNGKPGETFELAAGIRIECSAALWGDE